MAALIVAATLCAAPADAQTAPKDLRLVTALKQRDTASARRLLRQPINVDTADAEGMTPLHWAAHWDDVELVKLLLAAGANAKAANRYGVTPLHEAATAANAAMTNALIRAGAGVDAAYGDGETPLMIAARTGNAAVVRMLLEAGAAVNAAETFRGQTPLMLAAVENHAAVVEALLNAGANPNARTAEYAFQKLTGGAGGIIHDRPQGGLTALILAARQGATGSVAALLAGGASMNDQEPQYGFTALQTAIFNGHYATARLLIEKGADVNDGSLYITTEMRNLTHYTNRPNPPAVSHGVSHGDILALLLAKGADPNRPYTKAVPPRQAQGEIRVPAGATPLSRAVRGLDLAAVRMLVAGGANPNQPIKDGSTPLMAAAGLAARRGGDEDSAGAGRTDPIDIIKVLVGAGADVNAVDGAGMTALHYAAARNATAVMDYLVSRGARIDLKDKQGRTAADYTGKPAGK